MKKFGVLNTCWPHKFGMPGDEEIGRQLIP